MSRKHSTSRTAHAVQEITASRVSESGNTSGKNPGLTPSTLRIGRRYRANRVDSDYDAIVIGSGIGGLTTAACLSQMGRKVIVLEQHYTAGGFTHSYARNGYEWDVGVHYIGDMGAATPARRLFDYITDSKLKWSPMAKCYDRILVGEQSYDLVAGKDNFVEELKRRFPGEQRAIDEYLKLLRAAGGFAGFYFMSKLLPESVVRLVKPLLTRLYPSFLKKNTYNVLRTLTDNETLIAVLTGQWGDCGLPPHQSSFLMHAVVARHYLYGGFYPVGGASRMAEAIIPVIQRGGGEVFTYADVKQIAFQGLRAVGVEMADGHVIKAPVVISNAGVHNTFAKLMPERMAGKYGYATHLKKVAPSIGHLCLYVGLKASAQSLGLPQTNYWIYENVDFKGNVAAFYKDMNQPFPLIFISFPSAKDPEFLAKYPDKSTIEIVVPTRYEWFQRWQDKAWGRRGEDYDALKEACSQRLISILYRHFPGLEGKIDYHELSTPLSTDYFCRYSRGEMYGLDHTPERFAENWLRPKTRIPGLYLTGQDVFTCGVSGAAMAGAFCAVKILGLTGGRVLKQLFDKKSQAVSLVGMDGATV